MAKKKGSALAQDFNPSNYSHLDKGTLRDFVKAFLLRNQHFLADAQRLKIHEKSHFARTAMAIRRHFPAEYGVRVVCGSSTPEGFDIDLLPQVWAIGSRYDEGLAPSDPGASMSLFDADSLHFQSIGKAFFRDDRGPSKFDQAGIRHLEDFYFAKLCLLVDLDHPIERLKDTVVRVISAYKKRCDSVVRREKTRREFNNWKLYLMAYDLRHPSQSREPTFEEIAGLLSPHVREAKGERRILEARDVKRYVDNCTLLINGGYKKHAGNALSPVWLPEEVQDLLRLK